MVITGPPQLAASAAAVVGQSVRSGQFYFGSFLALNGRAGIHPICPLLKVDRLWHHGAGTSQFDPKRSLDSPLTARRCQYSPMSVWYPLETAQA